MRICSLCRSKRVLICACLVFSSSLCEAILFLSQSERAVCAALPVRKTKTNTNTDYNGRAEDCCESTCGVLIVGEVLMCYVNTPPRTVPFGTRPLNETNTTVSRVSSSFDCCCRRREPDRLFPGSLGVTWARSCSDLPRPTRRNTKSCTQCFNVDTGDQDRDHKFVEFPIVPHRGLSGCVKSNCPYSHLGLANHALSYLRASFVPNLASPRFAFFADAEDTLVAPGRCTNPQHDGMRRRARLAT